MNLTHRAALLAGILLTGCDKPSEDIQPIVLKGTVLSDGEFLAEPARILPLGNRLVVADDFEPHLHVLDMTSGDRLASVGKSGGGPGEFEWAREILEAPSRDGSFWIYDSAHRRFTRMALDSGRAEPRMVEIVRIASLPPLTLLMNTVLLDDSTIVASGIFSQGRLARARITGEHFATLGKTPPALMGQNVPVTVLQHA